VTGFDAADATFLRGAPVEERMANVITQLLKRRDQADLLVDRYSSRFPATGLRMPINR
jgi:hypothetical protein